MAYATSTTNLPGPVRTTAAPLAGRRRFTGRRGFTLIEAMIACVILALAVIAIGGALSSTAKQSAVVEQDSTALLLGRQLMEEICAKPFLDPTTGLTTPNDTAAARFTTPASGTTGGGNGVVTTVVNTVTSLLGALLGGGGGSGGSSTAVAGGGGVTGRAALDDVGDYNGYSDIIDASHPVATLQGKTAAVTNNRTYGRTVSVEFRTSPAGAAASTGNFALITVSVVKPTGQTLQIWRMASNTTLMQQ